MAYFPMFTDISDKNVIVVGGGRIALLRVQKLALFQARITVISEKFSEEYRNAFSQFSCVTMLCESFCERHLDRLSPVLAAVCPGEGTGLSPEEITELCIVKRIPVNVADAPNLCSFVFPAVTAREKLCIGVSTSGCVPMASVILKERIDGAIPQNIDKILAGLAQMRRHIYKNVPDPQARKKILRRATELCFERDDVISGEELESIMKSSIK